MHFRPPNQQRQSTEGSNVNINKAIFVLLLLLLLYWQNFQLHTTATVKITTTVTDVYLREQILFTTSHLKGLWSLCLVQLMMSINTQHPQVTHTVNTSNPATKGHSNPLRNRRPYVIPHLRWLGVKLTFML